MKIVFGAMLMLAAFPLLFWNEGRAVHTAEALEEGRVVITATSSEKVEPKNEGKLVHAAGRATTVDTVTDPVFGVSATAIALNRKVEMFQWTEQRESKGRGSDNFIYRYPKQWSESLVDSTKFRVPDEHPNPTSMPYTSEKWTAGKVTLGAYTLNSTQVSRITGSEPVKAELRSGLPTKRPVREHDDGLFIGENPDQPKIGDLRITFTKVPETNVSVAAKQSGTSFAPYRAKSGSDVDLQRNGTVSLEEMFAGAEQANISALWGLRLMGFVLMAIGINLALKTITGLTSGIPVVGRIVGAGTVLIGTLLAAVLSFSTAAVAWIFYRPLLGLALLAIGGGAAVAAWHYLSRQRDKPGPPAAQPRA